MSDSPLDQLREDGRVAIYTRGRLYSRNIVYQPEKGRNVALFKSGGGCDSESREIFVQKEEGRKVELLRSSFELSDEAIREQLQSMMNGHTSPFEGEPVYWFRKGDDIIIKVRIKHWELDRDATFLWKGWSEMSTSELTSYEL